MADTITMEQALDELRSLDPSQIQDALLILDEYDDPVITEVMLEVLPKIDTSIPGGGYAAAMLITELAGHGERRAIKHIVALFDRDLDESGDDHELETVACEALTTLSATEALPFLREALVSKRWTLHEEDVAKALATIGGYQEEPLLIEGMTSRRTDLRIACIRALRISGTRNAIPALEKATKSSNNEIAVAALSTLCILKPDEADAVVDRVFLLASDDYLKADAIRFVRELKTLDLSERLFSLLSDPTWKSFRFDMLQILVDRKKPQAMNALRGIVSGDEASPWPKAHAASLLLMLGHDDELVGYLMNVLATQRYVDERDKNFHSVNVAGEAVISSLVNQTAAHPRQRLELVELLNELRHGRRETFGRGPGLAAAAIKEIVGSEYYSAYDVWVAEFRRRNDLFVAPPPSAPDNPVETEAPTTPAKPWWKIW